MGDQIFISYSHQDREWLEKILAHLKRLGQNDDDISMWDDSRIDAGTDYRKEIKEAIRSSKVAVLLVSNSFLRSPFIERHELKPVLKAARRKGTRVFWIAVRESGYWKEEIERYQAANNPERPLAVLPADELDDELENICEKILSAARLPNVKRGPQYYLNLLPFVGVIALPVGYLIYLLMEREPSPWIIKALIIVFPLLLLWIVVLGFVARRAFYSERSFAVPAPEIFWEIVFNKLGKAVIEMFNPDPTVQVVVISDTSTQDQATLIRQHYDGKSLNIVNVVCGSDLEKDKKDELVKAFRRSNALYVFWTETIKANSELRKIIIEWAVRESHKPVLVVNFIPEQDYDFPFGFLQHSEAVSGVWRLLARSTERANEWRAQSKRSSRILGGSVAVVLLSCIALVASLSQTDDRATEFETPDTVDDVNRRDFSTSLGRSRDVIGSLFSDQEFEALLTDNSSAAEIRFKVRDILKKRTDSHDRSKEKIREALHSFAEYSLADLLRFQAKDVLRGSQLSFWRMGKPEDGKTYVYQVAWTGPREPRKFEVAHGIDNGRVIGMAVAHKTFVLWRDDFRSNDPACWSQDGQVKGTWDGDAKIIRLDDSCTVRYEPTSTRPRKGMICLGVENLYSDVVNGVCLDMQIQSSLLERDRTRNYLLRLTSVLDILPNELLITKELRDRITAAELAGTK